METKIGKRYGDDRTKLQTVIPLKTPFLLFVDPSSVCNFKCKFCPCGGANKNQWARDKQTSMMSYELFRKIVDDLTEFPDKIKTLRLYKEGEPLMNKRLPDMINYARKKDIAQKIDFTTNASLLNNDFSLAITDAGIDRINISIEALDSSGYQKLSGVNIDFKELIKKIEFFYKHKNNCHVFIKITDLGLGNYNEQDFYNLFGEFCDEMAVENISPVWPGFNLNNDLRNTNNYDIYGEEMNKRKSAQVCPYLFYSLSVNSDGSVSACLMDWNHKLIVGDVRKQSLREIWEGDAMNQLRINHLNLNKAKYEACDCCGQLNYAVLDNIDEYREEILKHYITEE